MKSIGWSALALTLALTTGACDEAGSASKDSAGARAGCQKDTDCKGDRVCVDGKCEAEQAESPKPKQTAAGPADREARGPAKPAPTPGAPVAKQAPTATEPTADGQPSLDFAEVPASVYHPRLGPKMKPGSTIVHKVYEGPFGPSPRSLFAVTLRNDPPQFYVLVMGDDGKSWPAGPLADPSLTMADEIKAVSFFDADGNGTTDALVIATVRSAMRPSPPFYRNVLLKWTKLGMRRLLTLEPKIQELTSVAEVRRVLGR